MVSVETLTILDPYPPHAAAVYAPESSHFNGFHSVLIFPLAEIPKTISPVRRDGSHYLTNGVCVERGRKTGSHEEGCPKFGNYSGRATPKKNQIYSL